MCKISEAHSVHDDKQHGSEDYSLTVERRRESEGSIIEHIQSNISLFLISNFSRVVNVVFFAS